MQTWTFGNERLSSTWGEAFRTAEQRLLSVSLCSSSSPQEEPPLPFLEPTWRQRDPSPAFGAGRVKAIRVMDVDYRYMWKSWWDRQLVVCLFGLKMKENNDFRLKNYYFLVQQHDCWIIMLYLFTLLLFSEIYVCSSYFSATPKPSPKRVWTDLKLLYKHFTAI